MDTPRRIILSGITTLILVSQMIQLLTYSDTPILLGSIAVVFGLSFIFIDDMISLLKLNKKG